MADRDRQPGKLVVSRWMDPATGQDRLVIDRADPRVNISAELLGDIRLMFAYPHVTLDGDVLTVDADNRRVVYRIGTYDPPTRTYSAEWPD